MNVLFDDIQNAIKTQVPEVKWIDIDEGQFEAFGENAPVDYPCVLVDFPTASYSSALYPGQIADTQITIKIAFRMYERLNTSVPTYFRTKAFEHFAILKKVMKAINNMAGQWYSPLNRTSFRKEKSIDPKIYTVIYETAITDNDFFEEELTMPRPDMEIELTNTI